MRSIFTAIVCSFLLGCAATQKVSLYKSYNDYHEQLSAANLSRLASSYFSSSLLSADLKNDDVQEQLLFSKLMIKQLQHAELVVANSGCLVVVGEDSEQEPIQFNLAYHYEANKWLIDRVNVLFLQQRPKSVSISSCNALFVE